MAYRVGIVGASGYGGAELARLVAAHPAVDLAVVAAHGQAGRPIHDLFPNLGLEGAFAPVDEGELGGLDLVFAATPHGPALDLVARLVAAGTKIVDLSAAFRLPPQEFLQWYGEDHPHPKLAPDGGSGAAVYGLTEYQRDAVREAQLVANPGCYPTAALLALLPIADLLVPGSVVIDAKSGTSGAGRGLAEHLHHAHVDADVAAYGVPTHRHTGEIERWLAQLSGATPGTVSFTPHLVPMARGLLATCYGLLADGVDLDAIVDAYLGRYTGEPFVQVLPPGAFPHTKALTGSNGCQLSAIVDPRTRRVVVTSAIDNLGKGAAGQALQNANLMLGLDETLGLTATGIYP